MNSSTRWVKLYCKILENEELMNDDTSYIVFTKLLLMTNSKGQVSGSIRELSLQLNIKYPTLYKVLKRLESYQMIKQSSKHRYTLISICNWAIYQPQNANGKQFGKRTVSTREASGKQTTGVSRIRIKNKNNTYQKNELGPGYKKAKSIAELIKQRKL